MKQKRSILAFTSFILGLASIYPGGPYVGFMTISLGVYIGIAAILMAIIALIRIKSTGESGKKLAIWAIILPIVWRIAWQLLIVLPITMWTGRWGLP